MNIQPIRNLSFTSRIKIVEQKEFEKKFFKPVLDSEDFTNVVDSIDDLKLRKECFTSGLMHCVGGGITNSKKVLMWHFYPPRFEKTSLTRKEELDNYYKKMSQHKKPENALLIGGYIGNHGTRFVLNTLTEQLKQYKINLEKNVSMFLDPEYSANAAYNAPEDTWYLGVNNLNKYGNTQKAEIKRVKEKFSQRYICENDEVYINDKLINKKDINSKSSFKKSIKPMINH